MALVSLRELADLAIGMPEVGAVNFNALHSLLHAILQHLNLRDVQTELREELPLPAERPPPRDKGPCERLERKVAAVETQLEAVGRQLQALEKQMASLDNLPSGTELLERTKSSSQGPSAVADMWQMMQMKKKIEANESGVSKAMALFQDLLGEVSSVKATQLHVEEDVRRIKELLGSEPRTGRFSPGKAPGAAAKAAGVQPGPREGTPGTQPDSVGTRAGMPRAPAPQRGPSVHGARAPDTSASTPGTAPGSQRAQATVPEAQPGSPGTRAPVPRTEPGSPGTGATIPGAQPGSPGTGAPVPGPQPGSPGTGATIPGAQPGSPGTGATIPGAQPGSPGTGATIPGPQPGSPGTGATIPGPQPGSPGTGAPVPGPQPGSPGTGAPVPGPQPGSPGTGATIPGAQPGSPGTGATIPGPQPGSPGTGATIPGAQPGSPGTGATIPGPPGTGATIQRTQPGSPGTGVPIPGAQPGSPGTGVPVPGAQPGFPGTGTTVAGAQPGSPGTGVPVPGAQPGSPGTGVPVPGAQPGSPGAGAPVPAPQPRSPGTGATIPGPPGTGATIQRTQPGSPGTGATVPGAQPGPPGTGVPVPGPQPGSPGTGAPIPGPQAGFPGTGATIQRPQPGSPGTGATVPRPQPGSLGMTAAVPRTQPGSPRPGVPVLGAQPGYPGTRVAIPGAQPGSPGTGATVPGTQPAPTGVPAGGAGVQPSPPSTSLPDAHVAPTEARLGAAGARADAGGLEASPSAQGTAAASPAAPHGAEPPMAAPERPWDMDATATSSAGDRDAAPAVLDEALQQLGQLGSLYAVLKEQVEQLALVKCDRAELEKLQLLLLEAEQKSNRSDINDLLRRVASLQSMARELQGEKAKIKHLQRVVERMVGAGAEQKAEGSKQIHLQLGCLRSMVQEIEKELKELREKQDGAKVQLEQSVTDVASHLQEQLDKLQSVMENMMASSSALLSLSVPGGAEPRRGAAQAACPACSLDVSEQVRQLFQRYEQLQRLVTSFLERQDDIKAARHIPSRSQQDEEALRRIQATIVQVQEDCEKLNSVTGELVDDRRQKQRDIEALFLSLEKLEKEKADKEDLVTEMDVKADRAALAAKVSRTQFDATMEHLNKMVQDMLDRMTGQEQDWQHIQQKLVEEMDSKLDRLELTPFRQRLEERWKGLLKQLQEKAPRLEADDAAGIRKQLLAHFHCISCDRSLNMLVPSAHVLAIPPMPALPSRHSGRPHTVFELEQIRQHSRSLRQGPAAPPSPLAAPLPERDARSLRCAHERMTRDMETVQLHYGGGARASSQMIRDLLQLPCRGPALQRERPAECAYLSVARPCGGRHTLTHPLQRCLHLRHLPRGRPRHLEPGTKHEMELLGQDGHIYKGRRDTPLPAIASKDGEAGTGSPRRKQPSRGPWAALDAGAPPSRPQSAAAPRTPPGSAALALRERPASLPGEPRAAELPAEAAQ